MRAAFLFAHVTIGLIALAVFSTSAFSASTTRPNIVLVMADDQGWGQTGYYDHPLLKTPNLDAMAAAGLRFDRFYAAAPVCSPTRASVLTGRSSMRTGVPSHGFALRHQEKTIASALRRAGYATGHFGKWHLNGLRGPGVPLFDSDTHHPGTFGFDTWLSVTNFFDRDPLMSRNGKWIEFQGDSSEIIVDQALQFLTEQAKADKPSFTVIWYGTPHDPFRATEADMQPFQQLDEDSRNQHGELVAMDRSIGTLRAKLRELDIAENTLVWYCSDNGGLGKIKPDTVGGLRGYKGSVYEGGLRVPAIIEWPAGITTPRVTKYPAVVMDIFPTIAQMVGIPPEDLQSPQDGLSLKPLFAAELGARPKPIPFHYAGNTVLLDNNYKLLHVGKKAAPRRYELYDLNADPREQSNLYASQPRIAEKMTIAMTAWKASMQASVDGNDYAEGSLLPGDPEPQFWMDMDIYRPFFEEWRKRPEYRHRLRSKPARSGFRQNSP